MGLDTDLVSHDEKNFEGSLQAISNFHQLTHG